MKALFRFDFITDFNVCFHAACFIHFEDPYSLSYIVLSRNWLQILLWHLKRCPVRWSMVVPP